MTTELFIPPGCKTLEENEWQQIRLGIQGFPKTGKTVNACSFPNPVVISFDRGLAFLSGRKDVLEVPFHSNEYINSIVPKGTPMYSDFRTNKPKIRPANRKYALIKFLETDAQKLTQNQTLIIDGNTGVQAAFHTEYWTDPALDKDGALKPYVEYKDKIDYYTEIMTAVKALKCHVIYLAHETNDRDKKGELNGQIRPLLSGQFIDELQSHFTDWFRALVANKPSVGKEDEFCKTWGITRAELPSWVSSTPPNVGSIFVWQTQPDSLVKCGTSLCAAPKFILANYETFCKYRRKKI